MSYAVSTTNIVRAGMPFRMFIGNRCRCAADRALQDAGTGMIPCADPKD